MNKHNITNFDYLLFLAVCILITFGVLFIYSSGINSNGILTSNEFIKQIIWGITGIILMGLMLIYDYRKIKDRTLLLYIIGMIILLYTVLFGKYSHGAKSWIGIGQLGIQPSEFTKIIYILFLAFYLDRSQKEIPITRFIKAIIILAIPLMLILAQPDLGTATVYIPIFLVMTFIAGLPMRYISFVGLILICTLLAILFPMWESLIAGKTTFISIALTNKNYTLILFLAFGVATVFSLIGFALFRRKYYYWLSYVFSIISISILAAMVGVKILRDYQLMRLIVFLDPSVDALGSGWNINQSILAIGSGGIKGLGFLNGIQSHYKFLPEQSTDFIFSILSEELGFIGGLAVFAFYGIIFWRMTAIFHRCEDFYGKLITVGFLTMFFFHFMINVGMVIGIMPIMGIPLLFLSYGGSSLWAAMIGIGVVLGINLRQL